MTEFLEVLAEERRQIVLLGEDRVSIGSQASNDIVLTDTTVSRLHAVIEPYAGGWTVRDLGSRNGTFVNGERVLAERAMHTGDEVRIGGARIVLRSTDPARGSATATAETAPSLTPREREILVELCRPLLSEDLFTEPATVRAIAERLVVTDGAVKHHLGNLYGKFGVLDIERRRTRLANEAIRRGAVSIADLRPPH
jgi:DNA-binding CsgD family transcriptional regulator